MDRQQVITVLESLANGVDPTTGARIPHDAFHSADTVRALFVASTLLKAGDAAPAAPRSARSRFTAAGTPWSAEEDARLCRELDAGMTMAQMALQHGRTSGAIASRLVKLGRIDPTTVKPRERGTRVAS